MGLYGYHPSPDRQRLQLANPCLRMLADACDTVILLLSLEITSRKKLGITAITELLQPTPIFYH